MWLLRHGGLVLLVMLRVCLGLGDVRVRGWNRVAVGDLLGRGITVEGGLFEEEEQEDAADPAETTREPL